jgi:peptide deformylase
MMINLLFFFVIAAASSCVVAFALAFPLIPENVSCRRSKALCSNCRRPKKAPSEVVSVVFLNMVEDANRSVIRTTLLPRRTFLGVATATSAAVAIGLVGTMTAPGPRQTTLSPREVDNDWKGGTLLSIMSLDEAYQYVLDHDYHDDDNDHDDTTKDNNSNNNNKKTCCTFPFARWPDPILRQPAIPLSTPWSLDTRIKLQTIAMALQQTADQQGAVGLAAQQCGISVSLVYLKKKRDHLLWRKKDDDDLFLVNPRIVQRSSEQQMKVWNETCLVLPSSFSAIVLRDDIVVIEYETLTTGETKQITLQGELARAAQHEMQHDHGILIIDHVVDYEQLLPLFSQQQQQQQQGRMMESRQAHEQRMLRAFARDITPSTLPQQ